jgi:hypothetical protein
MALSDRLAKQLKRKDVSQEIIDKECRERLVETERWRETRLALEASQMRKAVEGLPSTAFSTPHDAAFSLSPFRPLFSVRQT